MTQVRKNTLLLGTGKGLVVFKRSPSGWQYEGVTFLGLPVSIVYADDRHDTWWAALPHRHWGVKLHRSNDHGRSWEAVPTPTYPADARLRSGKAATLRNIWAMAHGGADQPDKLWLGTEPGGLFVSENRGDQFHLLRELWDHPSRQDEWFGAGRDEPFIHSIVVDPNDSDHFYIAVSCAGVFETRDGGLTWAVRNKGLIAAYLPNPEAEIGHDPHLLLACGSKPEVMWQQNHCGIFRSIDAGMQWQKVSGEDGFPDYGFALAIEDEDPETAWVIPAVSDEMRVAVDQQLCVCRTSDGGRSWEALRNGLPQTGAFDIAFRHALAKSGPFLAFGTTTGNAFISEDYGDSWQSLSHHLPRVNSVAFV